MGRKRNIDSKKMGPMKALIESFNFSNRVANAALKMSERIEQLDSSTTVASFNIKRYNRLTALVSDLIVMRGLLKTAKLETYEDYILKKIIDRAFYTVPHVKK